MKSLNAEIKKRNAAFTSASRAEKRVLIAKDIIQLLKTQKISATTGDWLTTYKEGEVTDEDSFQAAVLSNQATCSCCALGSMVVSCTLFRNKASIEETEDRAAYVAPGAAEWTDKSGLRKLFGPVQLSMIEAAFEQGDGGADYSIIPVQKLDAAVDFGYNHYDSKSRLIAIMQNIIDNEGTFKP
jgi:hypothetical protein